MKLIIITLGIYLLYGCAAKNAVHNTREAIYKNDIQKYSKTRNIDEIALDPISKSIYFCIQGNYYDQGTDYYTLVITEKMRIQTQNRRIKKQVSYSDLKIGCSFKNKSELRYFSEPNTDSTNDSTYDSELFDIDQNTMNSTFKSIYKFHLIDTSHNTGKKYKSFEAHINTDYSLFNATGLYLYEYQDNSPLPSRKNEFYIRSIIYERNLEKHDPHKYEDIAEIFDAITSPVQLFFCILTIGLVCSDDPHSFGAHH